MRVLYVPWKRDIPLDLALGRTIDTRAKGIAILEHVRKMHTHEFASMRSGMCDLVVTSVKSIPTAVRIKVLSRRNCLIASREKVETSRKYERSIAHAARLSHVSHGTRFRGMTADKVYVYRGEMSGYFTINRKTLCALHLPSFYYFRKRTSLRWVSTCRKCIRSSRSNN